MGMLCCECWYLHLQLNMLIDKTEKWGSVHQFFLPKTQGKPFWAPSSMHKEIWRSVTFRQTTVESGKNVTFFEQLFCFCQLVLVVWNTFGAKYKMSFISWVKQNWHFLRQCRKKLPFPHLGDFWGKRGPGKIISPVADSAGACTTRLFLLDHRTTCTVFPVFAMFAMTTMADSGTMTPVSQVTSIKAGWAHFSLPFERLIFRQAHKRPTKLDDQFLEILTRWTRWQASFFIILKGKTSKPAQMNSSLTKIFEAEKIWQK